MRTLYGGMGFTEGPVVTPDGLVWTSVSQGCIYRDGEVLARLGGGPNGAALGSDGDVYVTQNGGIDFERWGLPVDAPNEPVPPGIVRIDSKGAVEHVLGPDGLRTPNDLVFVDGILHFTDSEARTVLNAEGAVVSSGWGYPNGIAVGPDGVWVADTRRRHVAHLTDGRTIAMPGAGPDGILFDHEGRLFAACTSDAAVHVFEHDHHIGSYVAEGPALFTNCCLRDGELIVTSSLAGEIVSFDLTEMTEAH